MRGDALPAAKRGLKVAAVALVASAASSLAAASIMHGDAGGGEHRNAASSSATVAETPPRRPQHLLDDDGDPGGVGFNALHSFEARYGRDQHPGALPREVRRRREARRRARGKKARKAREDMNEDPGDGTRRLQQNPQCMTQYPVNASVPANLTAVVENILKDPNGHVQFRDISASSHACLNTFVGASSMGIDPATNASVLPDEGIILSSGKPGDFCENDGDYWTHPWKTPGDDDLTNIVQAAMNNSVTQTYDACVLEFEFKCDVTSSNVAPEVSFEYIFGSEEYYEYVHYIFNDAFALLMNGENVALLPDGETVVSIDTVNHKNNTDFFYGNDFSYGPVSYPLIEADGFTTKLIAKGSPVDGEWNKIKMVVADVADQILDSYVLISANSFTCVERTEAPSAAPTERPSVSTHPSAGPSEPPTRSMGPSPAPSDAPSLSQRPSAPPTQHPTASAPPSISGAPSRECTLFDTMNVTDLVGEVLKDPENNVEFRNISASDHACFLHFYNGHRMGHHDETGAQLIPEEGIIMGTGRPEDFCWNDGDYWTTKWRTEGDDDLTAMVQNITGSDAAQTYDACVIEFEFRCPHDEMEPTVSFNWMFGSDEYYEYVDSPFNDAFAFFMNGENIAKLPDGTVVSINTVNADDNAEYFTGNDYSEPGGAVYEEIEADGFTSILTARAAPSSEWNAIKLVVADVADDILDSYVLLEAGSFACREPSAAPSGAPSMGPTEALPEPKVNEQVTAAPTASPTAGPTAAPSTAPPTASPTQRPSTSAQPSGHPSYGPTTSTAPSAVPTLTPSTSAEPSLHPSERPSRSSKPSIHESDAPSTSSRPSLRPSQQPTTSARPSEAPSNRPSTSAKPTIQASNAPSTSSAPSLMPTARPSTSSAPSLAPSGRPSTSAKPSPDPTMQPSVSDWPSGSPSMGPTESAAPSTIPSDSPTLSSRPSITGSLSPSASARPSLGPSQTPTSSAAPSLHPSLSPTESARPSLDPSGQPSISSKPSIHESDAPSTSPRPSLRPSQQPTMSAQPSEAPSDRPSTSANPTMAASNPPSTSASPSSGPTMPPSASAAPSYPPSNQPSTSANPSTDPTMKPSVSDWPSGSPSLAPTESAAPTTVPSESPTLSSRPSIDGSLAPSTSARPSESAAPSSSAAPSASSNPTTSAAPSLAPSGLPSTSARPSLHPSEGPSTSSAPSLDPSASPSVSSKPSIHESDAPSTSTRPSLRPSQQPTTSAQPSLDPTLRPSESAQPSGAPSNLPSTSSQPSLQGSNPPSTSAKPSTQPTMNPSRLAVGSAQPEPHGKCSSVHVFESNDDGLAQRFCQPNNQCPTERTALSAAIDECCPFAEAKYEPFAKQRSESVGGAFDLVRAYADSLAQHERSAIAVCSSESVCSSFYLVRAYVDSLAKHLDSTDAICSSESIGGALHLIETIAKQPAQYERAAVAIGSSKLVCGAVPLVQSFRRPIEAGARSGTAGDFRASNGVAHCLAHDGAFGVGSSQPGSFWPTLHECSSEFIRGAIYLVRADADCLALDECSAVTVCSSESVGGTLYLFKAYADCMALDERSAVRICSAKPVRSALHLVRANTGRHYAAFDVRESYNQHRSFAEAKYGPIAKQHAKHQRPTISICSPKSVGGALYLVRANADCLALDEFSTNAICCSESVCSSFYLVQTDVDCLALDKCRAVTICRSQSISSTFYLVEPNADGLAESVGSAVAVCSPQSVRSAIYLIKANAGRHYAAFDVRESHYQHRSFADAKCGPIAKQHAKHQRPTISICSPESVCGALNFVRANADCLALDKCQAITICRSQSIGSAIYLVETYADSLAKYLGSADAVCSSQSISSTFYLFEAYADSLALDDSKRVSSAIYLFETYVDCLALDECSTNAICCSESVCSSFYLVQTDPGWHCVAFYILESYHQRPASAAPSHSVAPTSSTKPSSSLSPTRGPTCGNENITAVDDFASTQPGVNVTIDVLDNDIPVEGWENLTVNSLLYNGTHGTCIIYDEGASVLYIADPVYEGEDTCIYEACDAYPTPRCDIAVITITIGCGNPVADDDYVTTEKNVPVDVFPLENDEAVCGSNLTINTVDDAVVGECIIVSDEQVLYVPETGYVGLDSCDYQACDDRGLCANATIFVNVTGDSEPCEGLSCDNETITAVDDFASTQPGVNVTIDALDNDIPVPGWENLTVNSIPYNGTHGTCVISDDGATVLYIADPVYEGEDHCIYEACDAYSPPRCDFAKITITIDACGNPVANDDYVTTEKNTPVDVFPLENDEAVCGSNLTINTVDDAVVGECVIVAEDQVLYIPEPGYVGPDSCDYQACDDRGLCDNATIFINVTGDSENCYDDKRLDTPTPAPSPTLTADPRVLPTTPNPTTPNPTTPNPTTAGPTTSNPTTPNPTTAEPTTSNPTTPNPTTAEPTTSNPTTPNPTTAAPTTSNPTTPNPTTAEPTTSNPTTAEPTTSNPTTPNPTTAEPTTANPTTPVDTPTTSPTCDNATITAVDDTTTTQSGVHVMIEVLDNDIPVPGWENLTVSSMPFPGRHGMCVISGDAVWYLADETYEGEDTCIYEACDDYPRQRCDIAAITITIACGDPVANDDYVSTDKNVAVAAFPLVNDTSVCGHDLTITSVGDATHGECAIASANEVMYVPEPGYVGPDSCDYDACDDRGLCANATIFVNVTGDSEPCDDDNKLGTGAPTPRLVPEPRILTAAPSAGPSKSPSTRPTPPPTTQNPTEAPSTKPTRSPTDEPTTASPSQNPTASPSTKPTRSPTNEPTTASPSRSPTSQPSKSPTDEPTTASPTDSPSSRPSRSPTSEPTTASPSKAPSASPTTAEPTDAPTISPTCDDSNITAADDVATTQSCEPVRIDVLANDIPVEGWENLTVSAMPFPGRHGTCVSFGDSVWYFPHDNAYVGEDLCVYEACDAYPNPRCDIAAITITIVRLDPVANDDYVTTEKDVAVTIFPLVNDDQPCSGEYLTVSAIGEATHGECAIATHNSTVYIPEPGYVGPDSCTYEACDDRGVCVDATIFINVTGFLSGPCEQRLESSTPKDQFYRVGDRCVATQKSKEDKNTALYSTAFECCANEFWVDIDGCIALSHAGPGTVETTSQPVEAVAATTDGKHRFYPTYLPGQLCHSKDTFDSWESSYRTLRECCDAHFPGDRDACCGSLDMGGC
ncbi:LOW QUALITY PROTEIN: hypothetical protein ACHAXT_002593 [Thalassiosira profunda]